MAPPPGWVSDVVRRKALAAGAEEWLEALPDLVHDLEREWSLVLGGAYDGGTEAFVARVTRADGTPAVLKLVVPRTGAYAAREITALRLAGGVGWVRLLDADVARGALLLERLGPSLADLAVPVRRRQELLLDAARRGWRRTSGVDLPSGADHARWLAGYAVSEWEALSRPCSERVIEHAVGCARRREAAHDEERARLVHGDVHQWNALLVPGGGGVKLVDPDGLLAEPELDLGILMREDPEELRSAADVEERAARLATATGLDGVAIAEWGGVERVTTGLLGTRIGMQPVASEMLRVAELVAAAG